MNTAKPRRPHVPGRSWAITGFLLGSLVSIGGNVQAVWLPADDPNTPDNWMPSIPSQVGAFVWPLALMVSVEVLSRIEWPEGWGWRAVRLLGIGAVAGGSAVISYGHIYAVLRAWGYGPLGAGVGPLVVDGLMLVSGFALVAIGKASRAAAVGVAAARDVRTGAAQDDASRPVHVPDRADVPPTAAATQDESVPAPAVEASRERDETPTVTLPVVPSRPEREAPSRPERPASQDVRAEDTRTASSREQREAPAGRDAEHQDEVTVPAQADQDPQVADAIARIQQYRRENDGKLPSPNWVKVNCGMGHARASRLLNNINNPDSAHVELHAVRSAAV